MAIDIKSTEFQAKVIDYSEKKPVIVDFWASWCNPCKMLEPIFLDLEKQFSQKLVFARVNTEEEPAISQALNITGIPYVALFYKKKLKDSFTGLLSKEQISEFINKNLPSSDYEKLEKLIEDNNFSEACEFVIKNDFQNPDFDDLIWRVLVNQFKSNPEKEILLSITEKLSNFGSKYFEHKQKIKEALKESSDEKSQKMFLEILKPGKTESILEYLIKNISEASGNKKEILKNFIFACFLLLENSPLVNEYRKKLSRSLF